MKNHFLGRLWQHFWAVLFMALLYASTAHAAITFVGTSVQAFGGGAVTSLSFTPPAATAVGDVMLVQIVVRGGTGVTTMTPPAGWSVAAARVDRGTTLMQIVYYRVRTATETTPYTWNFTSGRAAGVLIVYRGADTTAPINASGGQGNAASTSVTAPSITTTVTGTTLVGFFSTASAGTSITPPCSPLPCMNGRHNNQSGAGPNGIAIEVSDATQAAAGATGTRVASSGATAAENIGQLVALKVAVVVTNPGRFNAFESSTAAGAISGQIYTKLAGTAFSLDIVALNLAKTAVLTTFTGAVKVELLNASNNAGALDANNCNANWTTIQTLATNPTFVAADSGRKTVAFTENNAWPEVRVRVTYPATGIATAIGCSTDNFTIRPTAFTSVTSSMTNTGTGGTPKARAGTDTFTLVVSTGLTGYNGTPQIDYTGVQAHAGAIQTGVVTGSFPAAVSGTSTGTNAFTYSEVGNFRFLGSAASVGSTAARGVYDSDFTSVDQADGDCTNDYSNTLSSGKYGCYFGITANTAYFGRFYPSAFVLTSPTFQNRIDLPTCGASTFSYQNEPMSLGFTITAINGAATADTTQNYTGVWAGGTVALQAENSNNGTDLGGRLVTNASPAPAWSSGSYILSTSNAQFQRAASPDGPYDSLQIGVAVTDPDGVVLGGRDMNPTTATDCVALGNCTGVTLAPTSIRFGRLKLTNAHGSELLNLPVPAETQYWNGSVFVTNTQDSCTTLAAANVGLTKAPAACTTAVSADITMAAGKASFILTKPNAACVADASINLAAEGKTYLQGRWSGAGYNQNPGARATFGIYKSGPVIYMREMY